MDHMDFALSAIFGAREIVGVVNTQRDEITFLKHENPGVILKEPTCFTEYVRNYLSRAWLHADDVRLFDVLLNPEELHEFCRKQKNGVLFSFRKLDQGKIRWARILVNVPEDYSDDRRDMLLCLRYLSEKEADDHDAARTLDDTIRKIIKCDFRDNTSWILKHPRGETGARCRYGMDLPDSEIWGEEERFAYPEDIPELRRGIDREGILAWFRAGNSQKDLFYRRKMDGQYRWVKLIIRPASDCTVEHPIFLFYIVDVHRTITAYSSVQQRKERSIDLKEQGEALDSYYGNIQTVLAFFTQPYMDCYVVDLLNDRYIKYKIDWTMQSAGIPYVGCYSEMAAQAMAQVSPEDDSKTLSCYASPEELRAILEDRMSFEYTFTMPDGKRCRTECIRIESENGVPSKMLCRTMQYKEEGQLLVKTFGSFDVFDRQGKPISFTKKKSKQLLAYLVDKYGFPAATADIVQDVLEKSPEDLNAKKYVSTLFRAAVRDLEEAGYPGIIIKEWNSLRVDVDKLDCDYYHLMEGDTSYWGRYRNEYMKEYSWAEETNAEILHYGGV